MGCNCQGARTRPVQSFADNRKVRWCVSGDCRESIIEAKALSEASGEPIRRVFVEDLPATQ